MWALCLLICRTTDINETRLTVNTANMTLHLILKSHKNNQWWGEAIKTFSPFCLLLHFPSGPFCLNSVSPKHLFLAPLMNINICVTRIAKISAGKCNSLCCRKSCCSFTEMLRGSMYWTSFPDFCIRTKPNKMLRISNQLQPGGGLL
jgi:hypothetical protein